MSSFLYPHTIAVTRPRAKGNYGAVGYRGQAQTDEDLVAQGVPAAIQAHSRHGLNSAHLPGDSRETGWRVLIPLGGIAEGAIEARDVITDERGRRFQTDDPYYTSLGYQLTCTLLET
jgi:hypothetical protein